MADNPRRADLGWEVDRQRASEARGDQVVLGRMALAALPFQQAAVHRGRWIRVRRPRLDSPDAAAAQLGQTITPPMTNQVYSALPIWAGRRRHSGAGQASNDLYVDREFAASLTDEALAWGVGTWRKRYLTAESNVSQWTDVVSPAPPRRSYRPIG